MSHPPLSTRIALAVRVVVAVVLGVLTSFGVAAALPDQRLDDFDAALADRVSELQSDRIDATLADLAEDGVSVSDDGRALLDEEGERSVRQAVRRAEAAGPGSIYVVVWAEDQELGATEGAVVDAMVERLLDQPGVDRGYLLVWQGPEEGYVEFLSSRYRSFSPYFSSFDFVGDPAVTLPRIIDELGAAEYEDRGAQVAAEIDERADARAGEIVEDGVGATWVRSVLLGLVIGLGALLVVRVARARLGPGSTPEPGSWQPRAVDRALDRRAGR